MNLLLQFKSGLSGAGSGGAQKRHEGPKVCGTCLGDSSDHTNEIVECDGCGVAVHEACYGIQVVSSARCIMLVLTQLEAQDK